MNTGGNPYSGNNTLYYLQAFVGIESQPVTSAAAAAASMRRRLQNLAAPYLERSPFRQAPCKFCIQLNESYLDILVVNLHTAASSPLCMCTDILSM